MAIPALPRLICLFALLSTACLDAQTLTVSHAFAGAAGDYVRSELITVSLQGADPFRPVTFMHGPPASMPIPLPPTVAAGTLFIDPAFMGPLGPFDGLGLFGVATPFVTTDANGDLEVQVVLPADFPGGGLPATMVIQAVWSTQPGAPPVSGLFSPLTMSPAATIVIDEPSTSPQVTEITPHIVNEGESGQLIRLRGNGFLPQSTVLPTVTFHPTCVPGPGVPAPFVQLISDTASPSGFALLVEVPASFHPGVAPPLTGAGPATVQVDYGSTGLYPNNPSNGVTMTPQVSDGDPLFLVQQATTKPEVAFLDPGVNPVGGGCPIVIRGSGFLECAVVVLDPGPGETVLTDVTVESESEIKFTPPPLPTGVYAVAVRNIDHTAASPRQSGTHAPDTDLTTFTYDPMQTTITGVTVMGGAASDQIIEGTTGATVVLTGTCQQVGGYTVLDERSGPVAVRMGSELSGMVADLLVTADADVTITGPGTFQMTMDLPPLPPGLAFQPPALTSGGMSNAGRKHFQIIPPFCLDPAATPHLAYAAIPAQEPGNYVDYLASVTPVITGFLPNNCGRERGNQTVTVTGSGFYTLDSVLPSSDPALGPAVDFTGALSPAAPAVSVTVIDDTTLEIVTPDVSALMLALPFTADVQLTAPDGQTSGITGSADDFHFYPDLADPSAVNPFPITGPTQLVQTTVGGPGGAAVVFTFTDPVVTIPSGFLLRATGDHPLIIRATGDVVIDGTIDLSGDSVTTGPFLLPAAGGAGGAAADLNALGLEDAFQGMAGSASLNPLPPLGPFPIFGLGGFHGLLAGGGGGGGNGSAGLDGGAGSSAAGTGGPALALGGPPLPVLGAGDGTDLRYPPGGGGGAAGGLGTPLPLNSSLPAGDVGQNGAGGRGGGGVFIAAEGTITVNGTLVLDGEDGGGGLVAVDLPAQAGGGGGGGAGGTVILQAIQGIFVNGGASFSALGGLGGTAPAGAGAGGDGGEGSIYVLIPSLSADPTAARVLDPGATFNPAVNGTSVY